jgi:hypothetical protein
MLIDEALSAAKEPMWLTRRLRLRIAAEPDKMAPQVLCWSCRIS